MTSSLLSSLRAVLDPAYPILVLVDPLLGDPSSVAVDIAADQDFMQKRKTAWNRSVARIPLPQHVPLELHQHPYLVELQGIEDPLLQSTLEWAQDEATEAQRAGLKGDGGAAHRIGGWLQSSLHPQQLAACLVPFHLVNTLAATRATYLRVADRRVLSLLRHVVGDSRVVANFGRLQAWHYLDGQDHLASLTSQSNDVDRLLLSRKEWQLMERGDVVHRAVAMWLGEIAASKTGAAVEPGMADDLYKLAFESVASSDRAMRRWPHRFKKAQDQTLWAALGLMHPDLRCVPTRNDKVNAFLQDSGTDDAPAESLQYVQGEIIDLLEQQGRADLSMSSR